MITQVLAAEAQTQPADSSPFVGLEAILLVFIVAIFYFLIWRPQSKRTKEHKELVSNLAKDDEIITIGGVIGRVVQVEDDFLLVRISADTEIRVQRNAISSTLPKGTIKSMQGKK